MSFSLSKFRECERLFSPSIGENPLRSKSAELYDSAECLYADMQHLKEVRFSAMECCLNDVRKALAEKRVYALLSAEVEEAFPIDSAFFWRVFKRKEEEKGQTLLEEMEPLQEPHRSIWIHARKISQGPPPFLEYSEEYSTWECKRSEESFALLQGILEKGREERVVPKEFVCEEEKQREVAKLLQTAVWRSLARAASLTFLAVGFLFASCKYYHERKR